ncbi:MAG TPA: PAS domain-containing protein [Dongiaceae bacterium]|nr:PAS domain-containing protein [Dongiaceae bacterium]
MNVAFETLHPGFAAMRDYLTGLQSRSQTGRRMPRRADLDPAAFRDLLAFVNLIDVVLEMDAVRFRFRLVGTAQSEAAQLHYAGRFVDDVVDPASRPRVLEDLTRVVATCRPHYGRYGMPFPGRGFIDSERVFYPLSTDDRMVDCILALHHYPDLAPTPRPGESEVGAQASMAQDWHLDAWRQAVGAE